MRFNFPHIGLAMTLPVPLLGSFTDVKKN